jgi:hypothetical protein
MELMKCDLCHNIAGWHLVEEPHIATNEVFLCDEHAPRYVAGRAEVMGGPQTITLSRIDRHGKHKT